MENLSTKEDTSNSLTIVREISSNTEENFFSELIGSQTPLIEAQNITETCPPMNQTLSTPYPENITTNDIISPTSRNNTWKYEAKISALKSCVQCKLSKLVA